MSPPSPMIYETPVYVEIQEELLPLPVAARTIYASVYEANTLGRGDAALLLERLDGLASAIGCIADLFAGGEAGASGVYRRVSQYEVHTGLFRSGGDELYFKDGRPPVTNMFVTRSGLERVRSLLQTPQASGLPVDEARSFSALIQSHPPRRTG